MPEKGVGGECGHLDHRDHRFQYQTKLIYSCTTDAIATVSDRGDPNVPMLSFSCLCSTYLWVQGDGSRIA
jgi:hypothetical protein